MQQMKILKKVFLFYVDGFKNMSETGIKLWLIIIVKLLIMFLVLKIFFFKDFLNSKFETENEKSNYVIEQLTNLNK